MLRMVTVFLFNGHIWSKTLLRTKRLVSAHILRSTWVLDPNTQWGSNQPWLSQQNPSQYDLALSGLRRNANQPSSQQGKSTMRVSPFSSMGFRNHIKIQTCLQLGTEPVTRTRLCIHGLSLEGGIRVGINARRQWLSSDLIYKGTCTKERNWGAEDTNAVVGRDFSPRKTAHPCLRAAGNGCMPLRKLLQTPHGTLYVGYPLERWRFPGKKATHLSFFFSKTYLSGWRDLSSFLFSVSVLLLSFFFPFSEWVAYLPWFIIPDSVSILIFTLPCKFQEFFLYSIF